MFFFFYCLIWTCSCHDFQNLNSPPIIFIFLVNNILTFSLIFVMYAKPVIIHKHILKFHVSIKEKECLKDQRQKIRPKGNFQLIPIEKNCCQKKKKKSAET